MIWLLVAWAVTRVEFQLTRWNLQSAYNGYGVIDSVTDRAMLAPIAYRVLVPWLVRGLERLWPKLRACRLPALYEPFKFMSLAAALWTSERAIGSTGAFFIAVLYCTTFHFDYWDWTIELGAMAAALTGDFRLALIWLVLQALSRPYTILFVAGVYFLVTLDLIGAGYLGAIGLLVASLVKVIVGYRKPYYEGLLLKQNLLDVRRLFKNRPFYLSEIFTSLLLSAVVIGVVGMRLLTKQPLPAWPAPLLILLAQWIVPRAAESRSLAVTLLWVGMAL